MYYTMVKILDFNSGYFFALCLVSGDKYNLELKSKTPCIINNNFLNRPPETEANIFYLTIFHRKVMFHGMDFYNKQFEIVATTFNLRLSSLFILSGTLTF